MVRGCGACCLVLLPLVAGCTGCQGSDSAAVAADASAEAVPLDSSAADGPRPEAATDGADVHDAAEEGVEPPYGEPQWAAMPDTIAGCNVERLTNASDLKLFNWQSCAGIPDCDEAVLNPGLIEPTGQMRYQTRVSDTGAEAFVGVGFQSNDAAATGVYLARENGEVLGGFRMSWAADADCGIYGVAFWKERFGVELGKQPQSGGARMGGLLGQADAASAAVAFEISPMPPGMGPELVAMGASRWLWRWYPDQMASFSNVDGSGFVLFAPYRDDVVELNSPVALGPSFLFGVIEVTDGEQLVGYVGISDGVSAPAPYVAGTPDVWTGAPAFAHSHVSWMRGIHPHGDLANFDTVELWASEFHSVAEPLQPYKVDDFPFPSIGAESTGGWGHFASRGLGDGSPRPRETLVWNLVTKAKQTITLPDDHETFGYPGITRTHMWILARQSSTSKARYLMRIALQ